MENKIKSMRIYVTEKCNAHCENCFNAASRTNTEMTLDDFESLCKWLRENKIESLKLMGGEPTLHTNFKELVEISQKYFDRIGIFTNGLNDNFNNISLRENDSIIYNFRFNNVFSTEKFHYDIGGRRAFEVQVLQNTNEKLLTERLLELVLEKTKTKVTLTLDCKANIFTEKKVVVPKLLYIENILQSENIHYSYDHKIPLCYLYKTGINPRNSSLCNINNSGVIDANLNLHFCLQNNETLIPLVKDQKFIPWQIVLNNLSKQFFELRLKALNKICLDCVFFNTKCNGGCWISNENITKSDILMNTNFPVS